MLYMLQQSLRTTSSTARPGMLQAEIVENLIHGRVPFDTQSVTNLFEGVICIDAITPYAWICQANIRVPTDQ